MPFKKGDKRINSKGRPKGSKNKLTVVKDNLVNILSRKLKDPKEIAKLDINTLIRFTGTILPKDLALKVAPDIQYISNTPRPEIVDKTTDTLESTLEIPVDSTVVDSEEDS